MKRTESVQLTGGVCFEDLDLVVLRDGGNAGLEFDWDQRIPLHLALAAPDLLAACEELVALDDGDVSALWPHAEKFAAARAALAKARGE